MHGARVPSFPSGFALTLIAYMDRMAIHSITARKYVVNRHGLCVVEGEVAMVRAQGAPGPRVFGLDLDRKVDSDFSRT